MRPLCMLLMAVLILSCNQKSNTETNTLKNYFSYGDSVESAGVKMIPIQTPVGNFKVWTKRFGNNPKIKILLLHGGPAMTHEYMECFETFFKKKDLNFMNTISWALIIVISQKIVAYGPLIDL